MSEPYGCYIEPGKKCIVFAVRILKLSLLRERVKELLKELLGLLDDFSTATPCVIHLMVQWCSIDERSALPGLHDLDDHAREPVFVSLRLPSH